MTDLLRGQNDSLTRDELIALCEAAIRPEKVWHDRDSASAQRQVAEAWALLRAGCDFEIEKDAPATNERTIWVRIAYRGFGSFEYGGKIDNDLFYIPTRARLDEAGGGDWY